MTTGAESTTAQIALPYTIAPFNTPASLCAKVNTLPLALCVLRTVARKYPETRYELKMLRGLGAGPLLLWDTMLPPCDLADMQQALEIMQACAAGDVEAQL
jgi:hypothetical protein